LLLKPGEKLKKIGKILGLHRIILLVLKRSTLDLFLPSGWLFKVTVYTVYMLYVFCVFVNPICSDDDDDLTLTGRQGRQQTGGDTYTLEIAFPAAKYV